MSPVSLLFHITQLGGRGLVFVLGDDKDGKLYGHFSVMDGGGEGVKFWSKWCYIIYEQSLIVIIQMVLLFEGLLFRSSEQNNFEKNSDPT